jgi:seryl-tRNA synthetase
LESKTDLLAKQLQELAQLLPNDSHPESPKGSTESTRLLQQWDGPNGIIPAESRREHLDLCKQMTLIDIEAGAKVTGSSWAYLLNEAAFLEQALTSYALSIAVSHGYQMISVPDVVRSDFSFRCGYQPREERTAQQQIYSLGPTNPELVLSGTAEIPLAGMNANSVLDLSWGPIRQVASGKAFRVEAGARGRESKGLYRLHQFSKVELYVISKKEASERLMEEMLGIQTEIIQNLRVPYRYFVTNLKRLRL